MRIAIREYPAPFLDAEYLEPLKEFLTDSYIRCMKKEKIFVKMWVN